MDITFPIDEAQLVALFMESVAYGVYLVTFCWCLHVLLWDPEGYRRRFNWAMVCVTILMAIFATLDVSFGLKHNLDAFIFYRGPGGADGELKDISYWVNVMKTVDTQAMALIGDGMLIYRCWVVYLHSWKIIALPAFLYLADLAFSIMIIYITATLRQDTLISSQTLLKPFLYCFFSTTIVLNILTTVLITWRIWNVHKISAPHVPDVPSQKCSRTRLEKVMRVVIESGLLYTMAVLATFLCELAGSNAVYGVSDVMVVVVGISFNIIIIRVDRSARQEMVCIRETAALAYPLRFVRSDSGHTPSRLEVHISRDISREISDIDKHIESLKPPPGDWPSEVV